MHFKCFFVVFLVFFWGGEFGIRGGGVRKSAQVIAGNNTGLTFYSSTISDYTPKYCFIGVRDCTIDCMKSFHVLLFLQLNSTKS